MEIHGFPWNSTKIHEVKTQEEEEKEEEEERQPVQTLKGHGYCYCPNQLIMMCDT